MSEKIIKRRPDLKRKKDAGTTVPTEDIDRKDITLEIYFPGRSGKPESSKLNSQSLIRIWIADNPKLQKLPYWKVEKMFKKLSKRAQFRIASHRKWFFKIDEQPPEDFLPIPYYHVPRTEGIARRVMHFSDEQISDFINPDSIPARFNRKKSEWLAMSERQRLTFHFNEIAERKPYKWTYVE